MTTAAEFVAGFEGFQSPAAYDVNAWRLGYGSDTEGPDQIPVYQGMTTTRDRALANLALRIPAFQTTIAKQIGPSVWKALSPNQRIALTSIGYNYGGIPVNKATKQMRVKINLADPKATAAQITALGSDNGGINRKRRAKEAAMYLSDAVSQAPVPDHGVASGVVGGGLLAAAGAIHYLQGQPVLALVGMAVIFLALSWWTTRPKQAVAIPVVSGHDLLKDLLAQRAELDARITDAAEALEASLKEQQDLLNQVHNQLPPKGA